MSLLSLLLLALSSIATTTKVITVSRSNMVSTDPRTAAHQRRADFESRNATDFYGIADDHVFSATVTEDPHCSAICALGQSRGYMSMLWDR